MTTPTTPQPTEITHDSPATPYASPLEHLADHIARIVDLVAAHVSRLPQRMSRRRGRDDDAVDIIAEIADRCLDGHVRLETRALWQRADAKLSLIRAREAATGGGLSPSHLPLCRLAARFSLSQLEQDILLLVAAPKIDPRYAEHWENVDFDVASPRVQTAISVLSRSFDESVTMRRLFSLEGSLLDNSLLLAEGRGCGEGDFLDIRLEVPRRVVGELLGESHVAEELVAFSRLRTPSVPLAQVVLPTESKQLVVSLARNHSRYLERRAEWGVDDVVTYGRGLVLLFSGPPGTGKTMLANAVAHDLGKRLFWIDAAKLSERGGNADRNLDAIFREARLLDAVLFFDECEQIFHSRIIGNPIMPMLLTRLEQFDGVAILATNMEHALDEALARRIIAKIPFRVPTRSERVEIWRNHLPSAMPLSNDVDVDELSDRYDLTGGTIKNAVLAAVVRAVARNAAEVSMADLEHGARLQIRFADHESMALVEPEIALDDVVLPAELRDRLDRFVRAARVRSTVLTEWGLGRAMGGGNGMTALLSGPPGTGKTMTAEAIARALERPLLRCNLSTVMSKWVGETSRNLEQMFRTAREQAAVLLFDEADALFAKRVTVQSANDRFLNTETGALLTQLERHEGVIVLTTNLVEELDTAFERRIQLRAELPLPGPTARTAIWRKLLSSDAPLSDDIELGKLGRAFELSGGLIRNAVLSAALEAASLPPSQRLITHRMLEQAARDQLGIPPVMPVINAIGSA